MLNINYALKDASAACLKPNYNVISLEASFVVHTERN